MPSEDAKALKKGEAEDEEDKKSLGSLLRDRMKKPTNASPGSRSKEAKVKKEEAHDDDDGIFEKPTTKKNSTKAEKSQKKKKKEEEKKKASKEAEQNGKKREKKVYDLPGQKRDPPEERDPLRIFYETLYEQVPNSEMAALWMMESGLLSKEVAKKVYEKKLKKTQQQKLSSPMKAVVTVKRSTQSVTVKKKTPASPVSSKKKTPDSKAASKQSKKRKIEDSNSEDESDNSDFVSTKKVTKKRKVA